MTSVKLGPRRAVYMWYELRRSGGWIKRDEMRCNWQKISLIRWTCSDSNSNSLITNQHVRATQYLQCNQRPWADRMNSYSQSQHSLPIVPLQIAIAIPHHYVCKWRSLASLLWCGDSILTHRVWWRVKANCWIDMYWDKSSGNSFPLWALNMLTTSYVLSWFHVFWVCFHP